MGSERREVREAVQEKAATRGWRAAFVEMVIILLLYVAYSSSACSPATPCVPLSVELPAARHRERPAPVLGGRAQPDLRGQPRLSLFGSVWYATAHYVVTAVVLVWLYRRGAHVYVPARRALVVATVIALVAYLLLPTAPPRLFGGYADVLALTSGDGWWGGDASAPKGLGGMTNQLAAFPSLHAGWALWVAMVLQQHGRPPLRCGSAGGCTPWVTGLVVVGTGNHWVVDVLIGWLVIWLGFKLTSGATGRGVSEAFERLAHDVGVGGGPHRRQAGLEEAAVARGRQPRVEHGHHAAVGGGADQPAGPLGEQQRRVGGRDLHEAVAAGLLGRALRAPTSAGRRGAGTGSGR